MTTDIGLKYFTRRELQCKGSGIFRLADGFGDKIDELRLAWGKQLVVNSCCRSKAYNASVGGHPHSLHVADLPYWPTNGTCAIDIADTSKDFRDLAWELGFSLGLGNTFTHCDLRVIYAGLPQTKFSYD